MNGNGIFSNILSVFSGKSNSMSPSFRSFLSRKGQFRIIDIYVCREPIASGISKFINIISFGTFESAKKKLGFDDIFHLYLVFRLSDGSFARLDKNATVELKSCNGVSGSNVRVDLNKVITLELFINTAINSMGSRFFSYSHDTNNCQDFCIGVLSANGLLNSSLSSFIKQPTEKLIESLPGISKKIIDGITHVGALASQIMGKGIRNKCNVCKISGGACHISHHPVRKQLKIICNHYIR